MLEQCLAGKIGVVVDGKPKPVTEHAVLRLVFGNELVSVCLVLVADGLEVGLPERLSSLEPVSEVGIENCLGNFTGISYVKYQKYMQPAPKFS
jgi:hypothetical protein